ncbi:unnamed protein product [Spirodela intermedia]|uniref:Peptide N-acetyl-beta-D-glucosaminyl asparaginase amidase A N-terminal domain-containing protein n=1 Tax=Spirodela intermedia TaxID=51605 RepID=A0A7I8JGP3_SPIIN|nr:unnamed protein product [Spirodela intermedia]CAA6669296.1 unnamed protein product [Spirodela intermedia]
MLVPVASSARTLTVMLENSLDDYFKGIYHVNVTIDFYGRGLSEPRTGKLGFLRLPSSRGEDEEEQQASGFVPVPPRYGGEGGEAAQPAALGLRRRRPSCAASWSLQHPEQHPFPAGQLGLPGAGGHSRWALRRFCASLPGRLPRRINPFFWTPVVAIKAFDLPTYDLDLTPFLGQLLNGRPHTIGLSAGDDGEAPRCPHLPLPQRQQQVPRGALPARGGAAGALRGLGEVLPGELHHPHRLPLQVQELRGVQDAGTLKEVFSQSKYTADVRITEQPNRFLARVINQARYPVKMLTSTASYAGDRMLSQANVSHMLYQFTDVTMNQMRSQNSITDMQVAGGWLQVNGPALSGSATTLQTYQRRDNGRCHTRKVGTQDRGITVDQTNTDCNTMIPDLSTVPE